MPRGAIPMQVFSRRYSDSLHVDFLWTRTYHYCHVVPALADGTLTGYYSGLHCSLPYWERALHAIYPSTQSVDLYSPIEENPLLLARFRLSSRFQLKTDAALRLYETSYYSVPRKEGQDAAQ
jgi:hypothetical protein